MCTMGSAIISVTDLRHGWYRGSAELDAIRAKLLFLDEKLAHWGKQLHRYGIPGDLPLSRAVHAALLILEREDLVLRKSQLNPFSRIVRKAVETALRAVEKEDRNSQSSQKRSLLRLCRRPLEVFLRSLEKEGLYLKRLQRNPLLKLGKPLPEEYITILDSILIMVDAGTQIIADRVAMHELLERKLAKTASQMPLDPDRKFVPFLQFVSERQKTFGDAAGERVVTGEAVEAEGFWSISSDHSEPCSSSIPICEKFSLSGEQGWRSDFSYEGHLGVEAWGFEIPTVTHDELIAQSYDQRTYTIVAVVFVLLWSFVFGCLL